MGKKYVLVTQKDIARDSGVSTATVSRIMKKKGEFSEKTIARVLDSSSRLGYYANQLVDGLRNGKTRTVGIIGDFHGQCFQAIHDRLIGRNYLPIVVRQKIGKDDTDNERALLHRMIEQRVEGVIILPLRDYAGNEYFDEAIKSRMPIVAIDRKLPAEIDFVGTDNYAAGELAAKQFLRLGRRRLLHYQGPQYTLPARLRRQGFCETVAHSGTAAVEVFGDETAYMPDPSLLRDFLRNHPGIDAIFTFNDSYAADVYNVIRSLGLGIPGDVAVIGVGDQGFGEYLTPSLTTVDQCQARIGDAAIGLLFERIEEKWTGPKDIIIAPEIKLRVSAS